MILHIQSKTLLPDVFENFRNMCLEIYEPDPAKFYSAPGLAWQGTFKKAKVKLDLLTDINMLLMVEKSIRGKVCHFSIYRYVNNKYMKAYDKNKESWYIQYCVVSNLYGWTMSLGNNFEWTKDTSEFNEDFIKNYNEESYEGYFLKVDVPYLEKLHELYNGLPVLPEKTKIGKACS